MDMTYRKCSKCHELKEYKHFYKDGFKNKKQLYKHFCSDCSKKMCASMAYKDYHRRYRLLNKEKQNLYRKEYYLNNKEKFKKDTKKYYLNNKVAVAANSRKWLKTEKGKLYTKKRRASMVYKDYHRRYCLLNKEKQNFYNVEYYQKNREHLNKINGAWSKKNRNRISLRNKERRKKDINFKMREVLRRRIKQAIKRGYKFTSTINLLGTSIPNVIKYLEKKFKPGMTWENHGKWHIDHIRPCAHFDLTDTKQQLECFHYTNLQPLWAFDNMSKGAKIRRSKHLTIYLQNSTCNP
jgi:hypothetical protein